MAWMSPWALLCGMRCPGQALQPGQAPSSAFSPPSVAQQPAMLPQVGTVQTACAASYSAALHLQNRPHVLSPGPKSFPESFTKQPQKPSRRNLEQLLGASCTTDVELSHLPDQVMEEGTSDRGAAQPGRDKPLSRPGNETPSESPCTLPRGEPHRPAGLKGSIAHLVNVIEPHCVGRVLCWELLITGRTRQDPALSTLKGG